MANKETNEFKSMCEDARALGEHNDCTVKAIAITTGVPYKKVHEAMRSKGRKNGKGATLWQMELACKDLGFVMKRVNKNNFLSQYPKSAKLQNITTHHPAKYNKVWKDGKNYIFSTNKHVVAVKDGVNHDWTVGRSLRVQVLYEVVPV